MKCTGVFRETQRAEEWSVNKAGINLRPIKERRCQQLRGVATRTRPLADSTPDGMPVLDPIPGHPPRYRPMPRESVTSKVHGYQVMFSSTATLSLPRTTEEYPGIGSGSGEAKTDVSLFL